MKFIADLHLHSKYSRAVSQQMVLFKMVEWARYKGISVIATGDFTHPFWLDQLKSELEERGNGLYRLKSTSDKLQVTSDKSNVRGQVSNVEQEVYFLLSCEVSSIYTQGDKVRRIHNLFFFPSLASVEKFNSQLLKRGANLRSDGRPIVGIAARDLAEIALLCDKRALVIPAHAWTPWFSIFGSFSGFDSVEECFGDMAEYIYGIETGLSSDPAMNWRIADLENLAIVSFSDAHSLLKMGREATVFEADEISYDSIYWAIRHSGDWAIGKSKKMNPNDPRTQKLNSPKAKIAFTTEFYPEEGKYHFTGHRECNFSQSPEETAKSGDICPVCSRKLTIGVIHRVEELAQRNSKFAFRLETRSRRAIRNSQGVRWVYPKDNRRPPYVSLVPLDEILAEALNVSVGTKKVLDQYFLLVGTFGSEFNVLLKTPLGDIAKFASKRVAEGLEKVRTGNIVVEPGYDGKFGLVKIWQEAKEAGQTEIEKQTEDSQLNLFA